MSEHYPTHMAVIIEPMAMIKKISGPIMYPPSLLPPKNSLQAPDALERGRGSFAGLPESCAVFRPVAAALHEALAVLPVSDCEHVDKRRRMRDTAEPA